VIKKVSADTIQELTVTHGFSDGAGDTPPTAQELIDQTRERLATQINILAHQAVLSKEAETDPLAPPNAFEISLQYAESALQEFEELIDQVPKGFRLTPVFYSKVENEENDSTYSEFSSRVRTHFLKFLANNHADELSALGICENGIELMRNGRSPADEKGNPYFVEVDHIIERSGGGNMSLQKDADPLMPSESEPIFLVNHFNNLILLPKQVHDFKNSLNKLQDITQVVYGESKWILMLVPETGPGQSGFVSPVQDREHPLHGVFPRNRYPFHSNGPVLFRANAVHEALVSFLSDEKVAQMLLEVRNSGSADEKKRLTTAFNKAVHGNAASNKVLKKTLSPALQALAIEVKKMFERATKPDAEDDKFDIFLRVYQGKKVSDVRNIIADLPLTEVAQVHRELQEIDRLIKKHANDNAPKAKKAPTKRIKPEGP